MSSESFNHAIGLIRKRYYGGRCRQLYHVRRTHQRKPQHRILLTYRSNSELYDITNIVAERLDLLISGDGWIRTTKSPEEIVHEFSLAVLPFGEAFELHPMGKLWDGT